MAESVSELDSELAKTQLLEAQQAKEVELMPLTKKVQLPQLLGTASIRPDSAVEREALQEPMTGWVEENIDMTEVNATEVPGSNRTRFLKTMSAGKHRHGSPTHLRRKTPSKGCAGAPGRPVTAFEARRDSGQAAVPQSQQTKVCAVFILSPNLSPQFEGMNHHQPTLLHSHTDTVIILYSLPFLMR